MTKSSTGVTGVSLRTLAGVSVAAAIFAAALSAAPASAAQNLTTCRKLAGDRAIRLPSKAAPCDSITTVNTSVVSKTTYFASVRAGGKWKWNPVKALPPGCKVTTVPTKANQCKTETLWKFSPKVVPLPAGCTISITPAAKTCKLVRAATEGVLLFKADPVRFSSKGDFSTRSENLPTDLAKFSIASLNFLPQCALDSDEGLVVNLLANSPLDGVSSVSSGITVSSRIKPPFQPLSSIQTTAADVAISAFGSDDQPFTPLDKGLKVEMTDQGGDGIGMFTYVVDVGAATVTVNASVRINVTDKYFYEQGPATCSISGSAFATLDS